MRTFKELIAWQKGSELVKHVYLLTKQFPREELYGLTAQMRRAAVSVPSNLAEGFSRKNPQEWLQYAYIAYGSANELDTQLSLSKDVGLAPESAYAEVDGRMKEVLKILNGLCRTLENRRAAPPRPSLSL